MYLIGNILVLKSSKSYRTARQLLFRDFYYCVSMNEIHGIN